MEAHPYYIDQDGRIIEFEGIESHIGIATKIIEESKVLLEEFKQSKMQFPTDFLIERKGYVQVTDEVSNGWYNKKLVFSATKMKPAQKRIIMELIEEGFSYENIDKTLMDDVKKFHYYEL